MSAESIISLGASQRNFELLWAPDEIALICFTSGTTGTPKGVAISHTALIIQSLAKIAIVGYSSEDVFLHVAPFYHIGGISSVLAMVMAGGSNVILPKFRADAVLLSIKNYLVSAMIVVPTMLSDLVSLCNPDKGLEVDKIEQIFPTVRILLNGGGSLTSHLLESVEGIFPKARIFTAYGMTETCSSMSFMLIRDPDSSTTDPCNSKLYMSASRSLADGKPQGGVCVGMPAPCVQIRIQNISKKESFDKRQSASSDSASELRDAFFRSTVPCHETLDRRELYTEGNVLTRGPQVMEKYWGQPKETAAAFKEDGWLDTGDTGWMDEKGRLWLLGRSKDMIKSGGENVHSSEVEGILLQHPAISGAVVFGIPDARLNEVVVAVVILKEGWKWTEEDDSNNKIKISLTDERIVSSRLLRLHCQRLGLSRYKVPKFIGWHVEPFPVTSTGKVKKSIVRKRFIEYVSEIVKLQSCL